MISMKKVVPVYENLYQTMIFPGLGRISKHDALGGTERLGGD